MAARQPSHLGAVAARQPSHLQARAIAAFGEGTRAASTAGRRVPGTDDGIELLGT